MTHSLSRSFSTVFGNATAFFFRYLFWRKWMWPKRIESFGNQSKIAVLVPTYRGWKCLTHHATILISIFRIRVVPYETIQQWKTERLKINLTQTINAKRNVKFLLSSELRNQTSHHRVCASLVIVNKNMPSICQQWCSRMDYTLHGLVFWSMECCLPNLSFSVKKFAIVRGFYFQKLSYNR